LPISDFELSVRSSNCLREKPNVKTIGDLVRKKRKDDMLGLKKLPGKKSLTEIKELLAGNGPRFRHAG